MREINIQYNHGVAVIMVMLLVTIATTLAIYIANQQTLWQRQVESQFERAQTRQLGLAGINFARSVLKIDADRTKIDHDKELWAQRYPAIPLEGGEVIGAIEDRQGLFNLNNVARNMAQFQRLLNVLGLPEELAATLADWEDADNDPLPGGAEDAYYLGLAKPYRAANRNLAELGELTKVKGYNSKVIDTLRPFVTVLPVSGTPVNVNFAPAEVLVAVIDDLSLSDARALVQMRQNGAFEDEASFKQKLPHGGSKLVGGEISVKSDFFWVTGRATMGKSQVLTHALLQRKGTGWPDVVWQGVQ